MGRFCFEKEFFLIYLGSYGRMVGIKCPARQDVEAEQRYSFENTLEGNRKAQARPTGRRTWSLQTSEATTPVDVASVEQFAQGAWGPGPFWFVSADAPYTNMLTPAGASCLDTYQTGTTNAGPVDLGADGWAAQSITRPGYTEIYAQFERVPVLQGVPVVGSAYVQGAGAIVRLYWTDATDSVIGAVNSDPAVGSSMQRLVAVGTPPANATGVRLVVQNSAKFTRPAVTWNKLQPWSDGQGCPKAVVHSSSRSLTMTGLNTTYSALSYTITEVG